MYSNPLQRRQLRNQGRIKSLRGPRPVFSAGPQSTEKWGGVWVCVRLFIIYEMPKYLCKSRLFFLSQIHTKNIQVRQ
jgi:hypothetical protein